MKPGWMILATLVMGLYALLCGLVAAHARGRGYSSVAWFLASAFASPVVTPILLALLPDRRRMAERDEELTALREVLKRSPPPVSSQKTPSVPAASVGDVSTAGPEQLA